MNKYRLLNIDEPIFDAEHIIEGKTMKDAIEQYYGNKLKKGQYIKQTKNYGNFVIQKYPYGKRYVFGIYQNA